MSQIITLGDVMSQADDMCQNYNVTSIDKGNKVRAANRAIEYMQARLGLPSDNKIFSFYYYEDVKLYDLPDGTNELLQLYYNTTNANVVQDLNRTITKWNGAKDVQLLTKSANLPRINEFAMTTINGKNQILMNGRNLSQANVINDFDSVTGLTFSTSISNTSIDNTVKKYSTGSLKFDMSAAETSSTITINGLWDVSTAINNNAVYRLYADFPIGVDSSIISGFTIRWVSSTGNYYESSATTQADGTAFVANSWNFISFPLTNPITVGSPVSTQIQQIEVILNHGASFVPVSSFRIDHLYQANPDYMDLIYYTSYKGTDSTGLIQKILLTTDSDICAFGAYAPGLIGPIALKAAVILNPQLKADANFQQFYYADFNDQMKVFGKMFPRRRLTGNFGTTSLQRP